MPRERAFHAPDVLDAAADTFTAHGYNGTSLAMLLDATGLGKQSLYNSFGDKRALYLQALDCAAARYDDVRERMAGAPNGRAAVALFFEHLVGLCASGEPATQICVVSAGLLENVDDPDIRRHLLAKWQASHGVLSGEVSRGQKDGSVASPRPADALADLLMSLTSGLRVNAQADNDPGRLRQTVNLALSILDQPDAG